MDSREGFLRDYQKPVCDAKTRKGAVDLLYKTLKPKFEAGLFDSFVVSGYSMSAIASVLAYKLNCDMTVVRKKGEGGHGSKVYGYPQSRKFVFVDDLIDSGSTFAYVLGKIESNYDSQIVAVCLYWNVQYSVDDQYQSAIQGVENWSPPYTSVSKYRR